MKLYQRKKGREVGQDEGKDEIEQLKHKIAHQRHKVSDIPAIINISHSHL